MIFGSEFGINSLDSIGNKKIAEIPAEKIDSVLLNKQSIWLNWKQILSGDLPVVKYPMESEDHFVPGKLLTGDQDKTTPSEFILLNTPGKKALFQYAKTDSEGNFGFNVHIDEDIKDLIIMPDDITRNHKIIIESSFSNQYLQSRTFIDSITKPEQSDVPLLSYNYQATKIYGTSYLGDASGQRKASLSPDRFYSKPDIELVLADYISLPKMEEVIFELLPRVYLKNRKQGYEISIADRIEDSRYVLYPTLMIDGVIIKDASLIVNLDPETVEEIDVIKEKYFVGQYTFQGLVNVITKAGDFSSVPLPDYMIRLPYKVIDPVRSFKSPDYSSTEIKNSRWPDFRNTLYWNPSVGRGSDGKFKAEFWSSDVSGDYEINIQGITREGKFISARKRIHIR
jgi:hypothetical protein